MDMGDEASVAQFVARAQDLAQLRAASMSYLHTLQRRPVLLMDAEEEQPADGAPIEVSSIPRPSGVPLSRATTLWAQRLQCQSSLAM